MLVECVEPEGKVMREVMPIHKTPEALWDLFDKLRGLPNFLSGKETLRTLDAGFLFHSGTSLFSIDDVGAVLAMYDPVNQTAHVHVTFWDKRLRGRENLCRWIALQLMQAYHVEWLYTCIPKDSRTIRAFAKRVGFMVMEDEHTFVITSARLLGH